MPKPDEAVKIFIHDLKLEAEPLKMDAVYDTVFTLLLPAIGATDITESDPIE